MNRHVVLSIFMLCACGVATAQTESRREFQVGFRVGCGTLDPSFGDNAARLSQIIEALEATRTDAGAQLTQLTFSGSASPDGSLALNKRLSALRLKALEHYVRSRVAVPDSVVHRVTVGIAWNRLAGQVEQSDMDYRTEALRILRQVPEWVCDRRGRIVSSRKKQLMDLRGGRVWNYMNRRFFGELRNAGTVMITVRRAEVPKPVKPQVKADTVAAKPRPIQAAVLTPATASAEATPRPPRPFYMALKTNLLYDLLAVPSLGAEFSLGHGWSVGAGAAYGWWSHNAAHRYWRVYGGDVVVRKWFGTKAAAKPLTGHHVGAYAQIFTYDFEFGGKGYMGGKPGGTLWDRMDYAFGLEYGYSLPIARRLNLDMGIGLGYWGGKYYEYTPLDGHYVWQATKNRRWFGPTRAEVSLVWLLGRGNTNDFTKGGAQ